MERKRFLKSLSLFAASPLLLTSCSKSTNGIEEDSSSSSGGSADGTTADTSCAATPVETEGPFPTKTPSSYVRSDIRKGDGLGAAMQIAITIANLNNSCNPLSGAIVDIWHCDVNGDYSQYGGTGMQSTNYTSLNWFRGRQTTGSDGQVTFTSIFPGWYQGRATHIHAHIYNSAGKSLLVTQIAFDDALCLSVNKTGSKYGYTKGTNGYTYNKNDNVFSDGYARELSSITGSLSEGFKLSITIHVSA